VIFNRLDRGCHIGGGQINSVADGKGAFTPNSGLPKSMTSIAIREPGGPDMLLPQQQPVPAPGEGEILQFTSNEIKGLFGKKRQRPNIDTRSSYRSKWFAAGLQSHAASINSSVPTAADPGNRTR